MAQPTRHDDRMVEIVAPFPNEDIKKRLVVKNSLVILPPAGNKDRLREAISKINTYCKNKLKS